MKSGRTYAPSDSWQPDDEGAFVVALETLDALRGPIEQLEDVVRVFEDRLARDRETHAAPLAHQEL